MFAKMSHRDRLDCLVDLVGMIFLCFLLACRTFALPTALRLPSPSPSCFLRVCFLFEADLKVFLPLITSPISGAANSNKSAPTRFAAGTTYLGKKGIAVLPVTCARAPNPLPLCLPTAHSMVFLLVLKQPSCCTVRVKNECWIPF